MIRLLRFVFLSICLFAPSFVHAEGEDITLAGMNVVVWAPPASSTKQPVLLFSHGFKGCARQSTFLTEALATDGYWVFAPNHKDASCHRAGTPRTITFGQADIGFFHPEEWNEDGYSDRRDDMRALWSAIQHDPRYKDKIDFTKLGLIGHSLGGYTVMGLGGAWQGWAMPGVKAVLALSPYSQPFNIKNTVGDIKVPIMFQGGTRDFGITPFMVRKEGSYALANAPKYFVNFNDANHFAWTNLVTTYQMSIVTISEAFLDHYVKGEPAKIELTSAGPDVAQLFYKSELGSSQ